MPRFRENSFAAACYEQNTIAELEEASRQQDADQYDCQAWGLSAAEWREQIALALAAKREAAAER